HFFVQGCDVWLNNSQEPLEACGTSGMKASINGAPHLSVPNGWWPEAYSGSNGWLIDPGAGGGDVAVAEAIYSLLEEQIVPAFYERDHLYIEFRYMRRTSNLLDAIRAHRRRATYRYDDRILRRPANRPRTGREIKRV